MDQRPYRSEGASDFTQSNATEPEVGSAAGGSMTFILRTAQGRVLVWVPKGLLVQSFGATGGADEMFVTFARHIDLLNASALVQLEDMDTVPHGIVLYERDIAEAQKRSLYPAKGNLQ